MQPANKRILNSPIDLFYFMLKQNNDQPVSVDNKMRGHNYAEIITIILSTLNSFLIYIIQFYIVIENKALNLYRSFRS